MAQTHLRWTGAARGVAIALAALALGCHVEPRTAGPDAVPPLTGSAFFPLPDKSVQATIRDVAVAATISLIDVGQSRTIATTLTDASGSFSLQLPGFTPAAQVYYLEAVKGLNKNLAGNDAPRLRTLVEWNGAEWLTLGVDNSGSLSLGTTAVSAIVALRRPFSPVNASGLMHTLTIGPPDSFNSTGTGISSSDFSTVLDLVSQILRNNGDPLNYLAYDGTRYSSTFEASGSLPFIQVVQPNPAWPGASIAVLGRKFDPGLTNNVLVLDAATLSLASGSTELLVATLPASASSGTLYLTTPAGSASTPLLIIPSVGGTTNATRSLPAAGSGTTVAGTVIGSQ